MKSSRITNEPNAKVLNIVEELDVVELSNDEEGLSEEEKAL